MKFKLKTPSDVIVEKPLKSGIYKILNNITEKFYIGSAVNFKARWTQHKGKLNLNIHPNKFLQSSWNLHGEEAFEFIILEYCEKEQLLIREQYWIDATKCCDRNIGYNLFPIAGSALGSKWTEERKVLASERMKTFKHTEEAILKMKEREFSIEHKANLSTSKLGHFVSEETKVKIGNGNKGKKRTEEALVKMRAKIVPNEVKLKISKAIRKFDKWPHELGSLCKCKECLKKKSDNLYFRRHKNKESCLNVQA